MAPALFSGFTTQERSLHNVSGLGTHDRIFFDGEEVTEADSARAWARIVTGPHAGEA